MKLIFLHIPKAAGTTFRAILARQYDHSVVYDIKAHTFDEDVRKFIALTEKEKSGIQLLQGHIEYGYHKYFSNEDVRYITFLRDPVKRIISHYNYVLNTPVHYLHREVIEKKMTLEEYALSNLSSELDNSQTRWISGMQNIALNKCTDEMLQTAIENMQNDFAAYGLAEYFDESLIWFKHQLDWKLFPVYRKLNLGKSGAPPEKRVLDMIRDRNALDEKLYRWAENKFKEMIAHIPDFNKDLANLQTYNTWLDEEYRAGVKSGTSLGYHKGYGTGQSDLISRHFILRLLKKIKKLFVNG